MKRAFTEHLVSEFDAAVCELRPDFMRLKSAAIGGGATYRTQYPDGLRLFLGFETIPQREMVALFAAWTWNRPKPDFNEARDAISSLPRGAISSPSDLVFKLAEGLIDATHLGMLTNVLELDPLWVPWETITVRASVDPKFARGVAELTQLDLKAPSPARPCTLSWEQYFLYASPGIAHGPTISSVVTPLCVAVRNQLCSTFLPFIERVVSSAKNGA